jgi:glycogen phosphorylase
VSTLDGWWAEAWNFESQRAKSEVNGEDYLSGQQPVGWAIGGGETWSDPEHQDEVEAEALYDLLERDVVPTFYDRGPDKLPRGWIARMKASIGNLCYLGIV